MRSGVDGFRESQLPARKTVCKSLGLTGFKVYRFKGFGVRLKARRFGNLGFTLYVQNPHSGQTQKKRILSKLCRDKHPDDRNPKP